MGVRRHGSTLGYADLLWCLKEVAQEQQKPLSSLNEQETDTLLARLRTAADLLGFEELERTEDADQKQQTVGATLSTPHDFEAFRPPPPAKPPIITGTSFYRVRDRQVGNTQPDKAKDVRALPQWYTQAKPTFLQETASRIPDIHKVMPEFLPLVPWARLWPFLQRELGKDVPGSKPDMPKLVRGVSQGELIWRIPKQSRFTWSPDICLLIDINEGNFPYRQDFLRLQQKLSQWCGANGLDVQFIHDEPGGHITRGRWGKHQAWRFPPAATPLLILSDMGMHTKSRRSLYAWLAFGQLLSQRGIRPTVLMPVAHRDVDESLLPFFNCIVWDGSSNLRPEQVDQDKQPVMTQVETLLALLFPALRVELGLLRRIRRLLPATRYDVSHEAAVWHHSAVNVVGDEWGWQASSRGQYLKEFTEQFQQLSPDSQQALVEQLGRYHAQLPDELYFEAMDELIRLKLPVPEAVKTATHDFMSTLVKTYAEPPEHQGLDLWVKRYLARHDHPDMRGVSEHQSALLAFERERTHKGDTASIEWPEGIPTEQIYPFINRQQERQAYLLRQTGVELELIPEQLATTQAEGWGISVTLLKLALGDTRIFHRYTDADGNPKQVSLNLEKGKHARIPFPPGSNHQLQVGAETFQLEILSATDKPDWVAYRGMENETTWVETHDNSGKQHRWYWHPPEVSQDQAETVSYPGFWYALPPSTVTLKPDWAEDAGRDQYGLYADANIAGVTQRFRWIQPGSFLMGSPPEEEGRYDDETQHKVILTQGYWLADTACTQALWQAVTGTKPSNFKGANNPVETISWNDITPFLQQLNHQQPELALRLPTEAEWENACRAGTTTAFHFEGKVSLDKVNYRGTWDDYSKYGKGALERTAEVKSYPPNQWGLYEMHGNIYEWCQDWHDQYPEQQVTDPQGAVSGARHMLRGGSWFNFGGRCRSASRGFNVPTFRDGSLGFRLALGLELPSVRSGADQQPLGTHEPPRKPQGVTDTLKSWFKK
jgi:formylglycine-generating enzyme required for sulfatase activity